MVNIKTDIISRLQQDILTLQGFKTPGREEAHIDLGSIGNAFPKNVFPTAAIHEFLSETEEDNAASGGFMAGIVSALMQKTGVSAWISRSVLLFPPALPLFGIDPGRIIFVHPKNDKELLWTMEEALKCKGLAAVVGELPALDFTVSRRYQIAAEQNRVTGFVLRSSVKQQGTNACVCRWKIKPVQSSLAGDMPGVGFPRWQVQLLKVRNGKPGSWIIEWVNGQFREVLPPATVTSGLERKAG